MLESLEEETPLPKKRLSEVHAFCNSSYKVVKNFFVFQLRQKIPRNHNVSMDPTVNEMFKVILSLCRRNKYSQDRWRNNSSCQPHLSISHLHSISWLLYISSLLSFYISIVFPPTTSFAFSVSTIYPFTTSFASSTVCQ